MAIVNWKCPDCGQSALEEVMVNVVVASILTYIWDDEDAEYGEVENMGGVVDRYQCGYCGFIPLMNEKPINNLVSLYIWLDSHGMLVNI